MMPVLIRIGDSMLSSYVLLIALAGIVALVYFKKFESKLGLKKPDDFWLLASVIGFSGFLGGRLHHLFSGPFVFQGVGDFVSALVSNQTGLSTFGAFFGVLGGAYYACWYLGLDYFRVLDHVCLAMPVGHAIARLGCFLNGCCYGRPVDGGLAWSVVFTNPAAALPPELHGVALHPTQLYEAAGDLVLAGVLYRLLPRVGTGRFGPGLISAGCIAGYGLLRFGNESFGGNSTMWQNTSIPAARIFSLVMLVVAAVFMLRAARWRQAAPPPAQPSRYKPSAP